MEMKQKMVEINVLAYIEHFISYLFIFYLKLKTIHRMMISLLSVPLKRELNAMLLCIQRFTDTCEVKMQVKCDIGKSICYINCLYIPSARACVGYHIIFQDLLFIFYM